MQRNKQISSNDVNTDDLISKLLSLESKDLTRKKKRKSDNHIQDLASDFNNSFNTKRPKLESKDPLVPSPIKEKLGNISNQKQESNYDGDVTLPAPIKTKKEKNKRVLQKSDTKEVPVNLKSVAKQVPYSKTLNTNHSLEDEGPVPKPKQIKTENSQLHTIERSNLKDTLSAVATNFKEEKVSDSNSSYKDEDPFTKTKQIATSKVKRKGSGQFDSSYIADAGTNVHAVQRVLPLLKDRKALRYKKRRTENNSRNSSSGSEDKEPSIQQQNWIQDLQMINPGLKKQIVDVELPRKHAQYALIRVPKNINPNTLPGLKCRLEKEVYITLNNEQYVFQHLSKKPEPILVNLNGPRLVNLEKVIVLQKSVSLLSLNNPKVLERKTISLPDAIKTRHPLFGVDYKKRISVEKNIKKRILEAIESKAKIEKRERKKKQRVKKKDHLDNDEKNILNLLNLNTLRKHSGQFNQDDLFSNYQEPNPVILNGDKSAAKRKNKRKIS